MFLKGVTAGVNDSVVVTNGRPAGVAVSRFPPFACIDFFVKIPYFILITALSGKILEFLGGRKDEKTPFLAFTDGRRGASYGV